MSGPCKGRDGRCENEAQIQGFCKSCRRYNLHYGSRSRTLPAGVVVINEIQHRLGSHNLVYRKAATGGWVRSTKTLEEFTSAQLGPKKKR